MSPRIFNHDLARAQSTPITRVSNIIPGDDFGALEFTYHHESLAKPAVIQMISDDCRQYPENAGFIAFSQFDSVDGDLTLCLDTVCNKKNKWTNITGAIQFISVVLTTAIESRDRRLYSDDDVDDDESMSWQEESVCQDLEPMELFESDDDKPAPYHNLGLLWEAPTLSTLRHSLQRVQSLGIVVGIYPRSGTHIPEIISLSTTVSCLGVAAGVLETWGLRQTDNLVLLIRIPTSYPSTSEFLQLSGRQSVLHFRFGRCRGEKPSLDSVLSAYQDTSEFDPDLVMQTEEQDTQLPFELINMSNSLKALLNTEFPRLLFTRRTDQVSWETAQSTLSQMNPTLAANGGAEQAKVDASGQKRSMLPLQDLVGPLSQDAALDSPETFSLPLVAMQLALHRLANCTRYCMVCNARLTQDLHSLKPYVCCKPLCLFQYQSLGLGSSIEHEIINAPYVVDMLVSFLYVALGHGTVRQLPEGLYIKTAYVDEKWATTSCATALADMGAGKLKNVNFSPLQPGQKSIFGSKTLHVGDRILIVERQRNKASSSNVVKVTKYWCRLTSHIDDYWNFETFHSVLLEEMVMKGGSSALGQPQPADASFESWKLVHFFGYWQNIDDLSVDNRRLALLTILDGLPSVLEMRRYLMDQPGRRLAAWDRINAYELSVLNWTVASNRSLIVQDEEVPKNVVSTTETEKACPWSKINLGESGSAKGLWMQFRFLQGSPEREDKFEKIVNKSMSRASQTPTMFAWHGSHLKNWHSIIRAGLDFTVTANGRSYGHGVYFSNDMTTSLYYSEASTMITASNWTKSVLNISSAIALCELIKNPKKFVSNKPHYVVDELDWIQCRYLFVRVQPSSEAMQFPFYEARQDEEPGYVLQDARYQIREKQGKVLKIPVTALPRHRRAAHMASAPSASTNLVQVPSTALSAESKRQFPYDADDVQFYLGTDDADIHSGRATGRKRPSPPDSDTSLPSPCVKRSRTNSGADSGTDSKEQKPMTPVDSSDGFNFDPTGLDMASLQILQPPAWASASSQAVTRLSKDLKQVAKRQMSQHNYTSGYHVHTNRSDNMFQWIVELFNFDKTLPLSQDMERFRCQSIVIELRFGPNYPMSPPFVRVVRPQLVPFAQGGGGHVTMGGAFCLELLTNSGWNPVINIDNILVQIRAALSETERPARIDGRRLGVDYAVGEAVGAFTRLVRAHGWAIPEDFQAVSQLV